MTAIKVKPLSDNRIISIFQRVWRWWLGVWCSFEESHPKLSRFIKEFVVYWLISNFITIFQYLIFLFLPDVLGIKLAGTEWWWPNNLKLPFALPNGETPNWHILGYAVLYNEAGNVIVGGGLGYMIAFAIGTLFAQAINFPMQRNITYRSHGNPWWQGMWYFIGWVFINLFSNAINGLWHPLGEAYLAQWLYKLLDTLIMGTISLWLFFLIFKIIFPDLTQQAKNEQKRLNKMSPGSKSYATLMAKHKETVKQAELATSDKALYQASKLADAKAAAWESMCVRIEKLKQHNASESKIATAQNACDIAYTQAVLAAEAMQKAQSENEAIIAKYSI